MATERTIEERLEALERRRGSTAAPPVLDQCTADLPHPTMVFQRGPNVYMCPCGKRYRKNGQGGLMEVSD